MGGCPYLIPDPADYGEYYAQTIKPILEVFPEAKVGGPASCWVTNEPLPGLIQYCRATGTQLDFISWHCYNDSPEAHAEGVRKARQLLADFPGRRPEMLVTEWNKMFDAVSCEDLAFAPRRAANVAAVLLAMVEAGLDWSCYYHLWDQTFYRAPFSSFFSPQGLEAMEEHWNRVPHRFGLFGVSEEVRPQYFVYWMLSQLGETRVSASSGGAGVRVLAGKEEGKVSLLVANFDLQQSRDVLLTLRFPNLPPGVKTLRVYRVDAARRWGEQTLEMRPLEQREVDTSEGYRCSLYCPADSVALVELEDRSG
jgi:hypothetical protein